MLSKCANPDCSTTLHYLREGKVFKVESDAPFVREGKKSIRRVEHFWLCGPCSEHWTLISDQTTGIQMVPKPMARRAMAG